MLADSAARWMLVLHTAIGVAAVGAATHLVIWLRRYVRGQYGRRRAVLRFAMIVVGFQLAAFTAGNLMYPTYRIEVRAAYLENAQAVAAEHAMRGHDQARFGDDSETPATTELVHRAAQAARWFDVKEHWIALGLLSSIALLAILALWDPKRDGTALGPIVVGLSAIVASSVWLGAIIGVLTASWRAV